MSQFIKLLIIAFIGLTIVSAALKCHNSCNCNPNSAVCQSCKSEFGDPTQISKYSGRYCPCDVGYYTSSVTPWVCSQNLFDEEMDACELQIVGQVLQLLVQANCRTVVEGTTTYVISDIDLDYNNFILDTGCMYELKATFYYADGSQPGSPLVPIPATVHSQGVDSSKHTLKFLLNDLPKYSLEQGYFPKDVPISDATQFTNQIQIYIDLGHQRKVIRQHTYELSAFTNRDQVQVFNLDVSIQRTNGCQNGETCIVVADLDVNGVRYTDETYLTEQESDQYTVGNWFYAIISFSDPTYTKSLSLVKVVIKTQDSKIYLETAAVGTPIPGGLKLKFPLVYPSPKIDIQVDMKITADVVAGRRGLAEKQQTVSQQFTFKTFDQYGTDGSVSSASRITFALFAFILLLL